MESLPKQNTNKDPKNNSNDNDVKVDILDHKKALFSTKKIEEGLVLNLSEPMKQFFEISKSFFYLIFSSRHFSRKKQFCQCDPDTQQDGGWLVGDEFGGRIAS